jgi:bifunctional DNA-binding transcriptional regulator/antitoxin component of YhaV-PrlF toxin-antitoxin module
MKQPADPRVLHGPHRIARNGQVVIPREVLRAARLNPGDAVYMTESEEGEGAVLLLPADLAIKWFETGRRASRDASQG